MKRLYPIMVLGLAILAVAQGATDYQNGVGQGLFVGLKMGQLLGLAQSGNLTAADEFNSLVDKYNDGLIKIFGDDQEMMAVFELPKINSSYIKELKSMNYTAEEISKLLC